MNILRCAIFGSLLCLLTSQLQAEEPPYWRVRISVQVVAIDPAHGVPLIPRLKSAVGKEAAYDEIQQLLDRDDAELLGWPAVTIAANSSGETASSLGVQYPTEFDVLPIPQIFGDGTWPVPPSSSLVPEPMWGALTPTANEVRDCGTKLKTTARILDDGNLVEVDFDTSLTELLAFHEIQGCKDAVGIGGIISQPEFQRLTLNPTIRLHSGEHLLIGSSFLQKPAPRIVLFLGTVRATRIGTLSQKAASASKPDEASPAPSSSLSLP